MGVYQVTTKSGTYEVTTADGAAPPPQAAEQAPADTGSLSIGLNEPMEKSGATLGQRAAIGLNLAPEAKLAAAENMGLNQPSLEQGRLKLGDQPVSPKSQDMGQFIHNIPGALADQSGNMITLGAQVAGDLALLPGLVGSGGASLPANMAANAAFAGAGDAARQGLAGAVTGTQYNPAQTATEAAFGATAPLIGEGIKAVIKPPLGAASRALSKFATSSDKLNAATGEKSLAASVMKLMNGVSPEATQHYFDRKLGNGVELLTAENTDPARLSDIAKRTLLGLEPGESIPAASQERVKLLARQMEKLGPGGVDLYERMGGISPDVTQAVLDRGASKITSADKMSPGFITQLGEHVADGLNKALKESGTQVNMARSALMEGRIVSPSFKVDMTPVNTNLASDLKTAGMLVPTSGADEAGALVNGYRLDPNYARLGTGKAQLGTFGKLLSDFFDTKSIMEPGKRAVLGGADFAGKSGNEIEALIRQASRDSKMRQIPVLVPKHNMSFQELLSKLSRWEGQLSQDEFDKMGDLKPAMSRFIGHLDDASGEMSGLRGLTLKTAADAGDTSLAQANMRYSELENIAAPIRQAVRSGDTGKIEAFFSSLGRKSVSENKLSQADMIEHELATKGRGGFLGPLREYQAAQKLIKIAERPSHISEMVAGFEKSLGDTLNPAKSIQNAQLAMADSAIPSKDYRFMTPAKDAIVGKEFTQDPQNLFRISRVAYLLSLGRIGGPIGQAAGLAAGYQATSPKSGGQKLLKILTSPAFQRLSGGPENAAAAATSNPIVGIAGQKLLQGLLHSSSSTGRRNNNADKKK